MSLRYPLLTAAAAALLLSLAPSAGSAAVLWDQSNWNTNGEGSVNLSSNSCSQISGNTKVHTACDVHFSGPVHITTVRIYETQGNVQTATLAYLWIHPKNGVLPTTRSDSLEILSLGVLQVPITSALDGAAVVVTAAGLNINLPAGDYWVSLTPRHNIGNFPWSVHRITSSAVVGDPTAAILVGRADAPSCAAVNSNWYYPLAPNLYDYAIKIEGDIPVPVEPTTWSAIKAFYR